MAEKTLTTYFCDDCGKQMPPEFDGSKQALQVVVGPDARDLMLCDKDRERFLAGIEKLFADAKISIGSYSGQVRRQREQLAVGRQRKGADLLLADLTAEQADWLKGQQKADGTALWAGKRISREAAEALRKQFPELAK